MIINEWIPTFWNVLNVRKNTLKEYQRLYKHNVEPLVGNKYFDEVTSLELQTSVLKLTPQNARHTLMLFKSIFREANFYGITRNNPTLGLRTQKITISPRKFLTWEQIESMNWGKYSDQVKFMALHGLRWSEAVVLQAKDIQNGFVLINKSCWGEVKSSTSKRKVPYLGFFKPLPRSYKTFRKVVNQHGISIHSLRRTYAYLLKTQGVHVTTAQKLMGHSDPMMTLKIYTSVLDEEIDLTGEKLRMAISGLKKT